MAALRQPLGPPQCQLPQNEPACHLRLRARVALRGTRHLCRSSAASSIVAEGNPLAQDSSPGVGSPSPSPSPSPAPPSKRPPSTVPIPVPSSPRLSNSKLPQELATLQELVSQLSRKADEGAEPDGGVSQLRQAVGELAEDLKRQISAVAVSARPPASPGLGLGLANSPGRGRLTPATDGEAFRASQGMVDLEGLIPQPQAGRAAGDAAAAAEPSVPRSEVIAMRSRLNTKLSESNTYSRFLLREIQYREDALKDTKAVLMALLAELKEVFGAVTELATAEAFLPASSVSADSRPSLLKIKLEGLIGDLDRQLQGVEAMRLREVPLVWFGMAEDVRVMGSFDGWTYGEQMSPETTGSMTRFSTTLKLRPGTYELKFRVDGEWRVAPEWPTVGHGMTENNVIVVD